MTTFAYTESLTVHHCWCGIAHAIPDNLSRRAEEEGIDVYCPLGHVWVIKDTEIKKLRRRLEAEEAARASEARRRQAAQELLAHEQRSHAATRGHLTRTKKRIAKGVCPCCNRQFSDLHRHMTVKHPDYESASA